MKRFNQFVAVVLIVLQLSGPVVATDYYVDFTPGAGSDSNNGTSTNTPFATIPGMRSGNAAAAYITANYASGLFTTSGATVPENTRFIVKGGAWYTNGVFSLRAQGGDYYSLGKTNIVIEVSTTWGSGPAGIDGAALGLTATTTESLGLVDTKIDGVTFKNFWNLNSSISGFFVKEHQGGNPSTNIGFISCLVSNCGRIFGSDADGAASGAFKAVDCRGFMASNCVAYGNGRTNNGFILGESSGRRVTSISDGNITLSSNWVQGFKGDTSNNDSGVGYKTLNSQVIFNDCVATNNLKGFDLGESTGGGVNIYALLNRCTSISNTWGANFNAVGGTYSGTVNFNIINSLVIGNGEQGINCYAGPLNLVVAHNNFDGNGFGSDAHEGAHINVTPDVGDDAQIRAYVYNNRFGQAKAGVFLVKHFSTTVPSNFTLDADYNSIYQAASEPYCEWAYYDAPEASTFSYGSPNGPGRASGNWYTLYGKTSTVPANGVGHHNADSHTKGSGCTDTTRVSLNADYTLTASYDGGDITGKSWYFSALATDRAGNARASTPDIGAYEYGAGGGGGGGSVTAGPVGGGFSIGGARIGY